jgi:hypothetical protein
VSDWALLHRAGTRLFQAQFPPMLEGLSNAALIRPSSSDGSARGLPGSASVTPATAVPNPLRDQGRPSRLPPIPGTPQNPRDLAVRLALQRRNVRKILDPVEIVAPGPPRLCIGDRPAFGFVHREGSRQRAQFCAGRACPLRHQAARRHAHGFHKSVDGGQDQKEDRAFALLAMTHIQRSNIQPTIASGATAPMQKPMMVGRKRTSCRTRESLMRTS